MLLALIPSFSAPPLLQAVARQLPHLEWNDALPPILSFYSFAAAEVVAAAAE
jgi:hypothetical protein